MPKKTSNKTHEQLVQTFSALGDQTRLWLVQKLIDGRAHSITELSAGTKLSRQAITKHLQVLETASLIHSNKLGRENLFALSPRALDEAVDSLADISRRWQHSLNRLKILAENSGK